jgi:hypothetical protein
MYMWLGAHGIARKLRTKLWNVSLTSRSLLAGLTYPEQSLYGLDGAGA